MKQAAAIDVGSNAIRYAIAYEATDGNIVIGKSDRVPVSLGRSVFADKEKSIDPLTFELTIQTLKHFRAEISSAGVDCYRAVGTSALRDASNGNDLINRLEKEGTTLECISGEEEARLLRVAVKSTGLLTGKLAAHLDIGGGSAEFSIFKDDETFFSTSERIGTIRMLRAIGDSRVSTERFSERVRKVVSGLSDQISKAITSRPVEIFMGTGGNVEELGRLREKVIPGKKKSNKVRFKELCQMIDLLEPLTPEERQARFGFRPDRADVILPAAVILREVMDQLRVEKVVVPGVGLKEGMLLELLRASSIKVKK